MECGGCRHNQGIFKVKSFQIRCLWYHFHAVCSYGGMKAAKELRTYR